MASVLRNGRKFFVEESERLPRKLAAILYADVAGYSRLTGDDEDATHRRLVEYLDLVSAAIESNHGQVMHYAGDAVLARFDAVVDALSSAIDIQEELKHRNHELPDERKVQFRIGVNLGDVIEDRGDIYGDGVNVSARLESLADPGGICVSESVYTAVGSKLPLDYVDIGTQSVKNIAEPIRAYQVHLKPGAALPRRGEHRKLDGPSRAKRWQPITTALVVVLIVVGGAAYWFKPWEPREEPVSIENMAFPLPDKPSIAVLPFTNMSNDPEQEYFVDGMTEDLITDLSQLSGLFVIARNSVFSYKGKPTKVRQVAEELGVRYVLEGSVRRAGDQIRINAQLIDATSGGHVWAKRYDGVIQDIFALQDRVSAQIVSALAMNLTTQEFARIGRVQTEVPQAYDFFLRGMQHYRKATPNHYAEAVKYLLQAVELDPEFVHAHATLASVLFNSYRQKFYRELGLEAFEAWNRMEEHLQQAMKAPTSLAFQVASGLSLTARRHGEAIDHANKAIALEPNDANAHTTLAFALLMAGKPEQALVSVDLARRLDPHNEYYYIFLQGLSEFGQEHYQNAMTAFEQALDLNPELWSSDSEYGCALTPTVPLLSVYHYLGKKDAIQKLLQDEKYACPINTTMLSWPFKDSRDYDRLSNGLRGAGIPFL